MTLSKANLVLHPIRGRILMVLSRRQMTTRQIAQAMPDVSQASVYRHVALLAEAGVLQVAQEIPVRGLVERVYALDEEAALVRHDEISGATSEDYLHYFRLFVDGLMQSYCLYSAGEDADPKRDGVAFWGEILYLTRQERDAVVEELRAVTGKYGNRMPQPDRLRYYIGRVFVPESAGPASPEPETTLEKDAHS